MRRFEVSSPFAEEVTVLPETSMTVTTVDNSKFKVEITTESKPTIQVTLTLKINKNSPFPLDLYHLTPIVYQQVTENLMTPAGWRPDNPTPPIEPEGDHRLSVKGIFLPDWVSSFFNPPNVTTLPTKLWSIYREVFTLVNSLVEEKVRPSDLFKVKLDFEVFPSNEREGEGTFPYRPDGGSGYPPYPKTSYKRTSNGRTFTPTLPEGSNMSPRGDVTL